MTTLIPKVDLKNGGATPTGAVNRPINEKIQETISVLDFGAVGDGVTDNSVALQNAINAAVANNKTLIITPGNFYFNTPLSITGTIAIKGEARASCLLTASNCDGFVYATGITGIELSDFGLQHYPSYVTTPQTHEGIRVADSTLSSEAHLYRNLFIRGFGVGIHAAKFNSWIMESCRLYENFIGIEVSDGKDSNLVFITDCDIRGKLTLPCITNSIGINLLGHCEGWHLTSTLVYNFFVSIAAINCSSMYIANSEFDMIGSQGIAASSTAGNPNQDWSITNSYFAVAGATADAVIHIDMNTAVSQNAGNRITNNLIQAYTGLGTCSYGIWLQGAYCGQNVIMGNTFSNISTFDIYDQTTAPAQGTNTIIGNTSQSTIVPTLSTSPTYYTATVNGLGGTFGVSINFSNVGNMVTMELPALTGTSSATTFTLTGGTAAMTPVRQQTVFVRTGDNSGTIGMAVATINTDGSISLFKDVNKTAFTASGTKSLSVQTITYLTI